MVGGGGYSNLTMVTVVCGGSVSVSTQALSFYSNSIVFKFKKSLSAPISLGKDHHEESRDTKIKDLLCYCRNILNTKLQKK